MQARSPAEPRVYSKEGPEFGMRRQNQPSDQRIERVTGWLVAKKLTKEPGKGRSFAKDGLILATRAMVFRRDVVGWLLSRRHRFRRAGGHHDQPTDYQDQQARA